MQYITTKQYVYDKKFEDMDYHNITYTMPQLNLGNIMPKKKV